MRSRRWIGWIAIAGVLLHAATVARHQVVLFEQAASPLKTAGGASSPEAGIVCHMGAAAPEDGKAKPLPEKSPEGGTKPCPICLGFASAYALPGAEAPRLRVPLRVIALAFIPRDGPPASPTKLRLPSNRGPPSAV